MTALDLLRVAVEQLENQPVATTYRIGIGITTHNRKDVFEKTFEEIKKYAPEGAEIVVVDDASAVPVVGATYRFSGNVGIARAKNKCMELLYNSGCDHFFLFDDDTYPVQKGWEIPYIESPEPHLMWIFDKHDGESKTTVETLYRDDKHVAYHATRGCMLYCTRDVLDTVGGMNPEFKKWGWEHQSWSDRIHAAGLTTFRYADVVDSEGLMYSMDKHKKVNSTATDEARRYSESVGLDIRMKQRHSSEYIEFRELKDVVITSMLTSLDDPQRPGVKMRATVDQIKALHGSLRGQRLVVLHTDMDGATLPDTEFVKVKQNINPYFERHLQIYQYLRDSNDIGCVWCVDGTDVEMLRNPFPEMETGKLYLGYETKTLRDEWMLANHPDATLQEFMKSNPNLPLLNAGLIGGDRSLVMRFLQRIVKLYFDDHIDSLMGWEKHRLGVGDMGALNYIAREEFGEVISWGPHVCTVFKSEEKTNKTAWWKHK